LDREFSNPGLFVVTVLYEALYTRNNTGFLFIPVGVSCTWQGIEETDVDPDFRMVKTST